jgi:hypothetical protein
MKVAVSAGTYCIQVESWSMVVCLARKTDLNNWMQGVEEVSHEKLLV